MSSSSLFFFFFGCHCCYTVVYQCELESPFLVGLVFVVTSRQRDELLYKEMNLGKKFINDERKMYLIYVILLFRKKKYNLFSVLFSYRFCNYYYYCFVFVALIHSTVTLLVFWLSFIYVKEILYFSSHILKNNIFFFFFSKV